MTIARTRVTRRIEKPFQRRVLWGHRPGEASDELAAPVPAPLPHEVAKQPFPQLSAEAQTLVRRQRR